MLWGNSSWDSDSPVKSDELIALCEDVARNSSGESVSSADWPNELKELLIRIEKSVSRDDCLCAVALAHASTGLAKRLSVDAWQALMASLSRLVVDVIDQGASNDLVVEQLLFELGLTLDVLHSNAAELQPFADELRKRACYAITDLTDGEGLPRSTCIRDLRPLMASWIRLSLLAKITGKRLFEDDAQMQLEWLVRKSAILSRKGGGPLFCLPAADCRAAEFFAAALAWEKDEDDAKYAAALLSVGPQTVRGAKQRRSLANDMELEFGTPTLYSNWASMAVMRSGWNSKSLAAVAFDERRLLVDISKNRLPVICGDTTPFIEVNGKLAEVCTDFSEVCWHSDDECDYLELEAKLEGGWKLQRQFLFGRVDQFLWVADVILGDAQHPARIKYSCSWPMVQPWQAVPETETRDVLLVRDGETRGSIIPPAAAEWRVSGSSCELEVDESVVRHHYDTKTAVAAAYVPLFFDLHKKRSKRERTWRQLTVAEQLQVMQPDVAVGYRVQAGKDQWMFYRSLGPRGNRSLMGQNTVAEFLVGRFPGEGVLEELVEVE
ncbi:MAG: hypothetical protein ABGX22_16485 [Pirellulaceae bacterium]|nr:hypothetical protein [Planctomycetaceae bacterium]